MKITIDTDAGILTEEENGDVTNFDLYSPEGFQRLSRQWVKVGWDQKYVYTFSWMGRPVIQLPEDMIRTQEVICELRPDVIIETGVAHGGSLIFSASMLALLDMAEAIESGVTINPKESQRKVLGIDIDIRAHNREAIEAHPMAPRIQMIEGSSIDPAVVERVKQEARGHNRVLVCLDSNHTHEHVLAELEAYAPLVSPGSYCVVFDTIIEDLPDDMFPDKFWICNHAGRVTKVSGRENAEAMALELATEGSISIRKMKPRR